MWRDSVVEGDGEDMNLESWLHIFKFVLYAGAVCVAIGTIAVSILSSIVSKDKDLNIDELLQDNKELLQQIDKYQSDLESKQKELESLKSDAIKLRRNDTQSYTFDGYLRESLGSKYITTQGPEVSIFLQLDSLQKEQKHTDIINLASRQIEKTPEWLTPYFYRGAAYAHIGQIDKAIADLEHVEEYSADDPKYAKAAELLEILRKMKQ